MATINDPSDATKIARIGLVSTITDQSAQHSSARPVPYGNLGHYKWAGFTGVLPAALAANSEIFQFRWSHATNLAVIGKIRISASVSTTMFAAGVPVQIDLIKSTAWSAQGTGGTAPSLAAMGKTRNSMASSSMTAGDMRIATTAALGAGTKTLETGSSMATIVAAGPITGSLNGQIIAPGTILWEPDMGDGEHPLVLGGLGGGAVSEGFSIRSVAVPATGTWMMAISIQWAEVAAF
jgi:hypothetical protein